MRKTKAYLMALSVSEPISGKVQIAMATKSVDRPSITDHRMAWGPRSRGEMLIANLVLLTILGTLPILVYFIM